LSSSRKGHSIVYSARGLAISVIPITPQLHLSLSHSFRFKAVDLINTYGNGIGVYAYGGGRYMVLTWIAVLVMLLAVAAELFGNNCGLEYTKGVGRSIRRDDVRYIKGAVGGPSQVDF